MEKDRVTASKIGGSIISIYLNGEFKIRSGICLGTSNMRIPVASLGIDLSLVENGELVQVVMPNKRIEHKLPKLFFTRQTLSSSFKCKERGKFSLVTHPKFSSREYALLKICCIASRAKLISGKVTEILNSYMFRGINESLHALAVNSAIKYKLSDKLNINLSFTGEEFIYDLSMIK